MRQADLSMARDSLADEILYWSRYAHHPIVVPQDVLTTRAQILGLPAPGMRSSNSSCRLFRCRDEWVAINLPRPEDRAMVPALLGEISTIDPWDQLSQAVPAFHASDLLAQARLLGLAVTALGETPPQASPARSDSVAAGRWQDRPLVVDLSSLWAGPLCGALIARGGCDVVKVETRQRPDSTHVRSKAFDHQLNGAKRRSTLDLSQREGRSALDELIAHADILITNARPRGLASLGLPDPPASCHWIAIGAHPDDEDRIGFGDDCAIAGGLVGWQNGSPVFLGDAVADPLAGLHAAVSALRALATGVRAKDRITLAGVSAQTMRRCADA